MRCRLLTLDLQLHFHMRSSELLSEVHYYGLRIYGVHILVIWGSEESPQRQVQAEVELGPGLHLPAFELACLEWQQRFATAAIGR